MAKTITYERKLLAIALAVSLLPLTAAAVSNQASAAKIGDDASERVKKNQQYLQEGQALLDQKEAIHLEVISYEKQRGNATSDEERQQLDAKINEAMAKVSDIDTRMKELENLNKALYVMEPEVEAKLYSVAKSLIDKHLNSNSKTYVGDNPVDLVFPAALTRSIEIYLNPEKVAPDGSNVPVNGNIDGIPIKVIYSKTVPLSCSPASRTGVCSPLKGGISVAELNSVPNSVNTLGYKATYNGQTGFVIAGHTAVDILKTIVQPHTSTTRTVGQVQRFCHDGSGSRPCDFAWVAASTGMTVANHIYGSSDASVYAVTSTTPDSSQMLGTFVYESSVVSGLRLGDIDGNHPLILYNSVHLSPNGGDSGSPLFLGSGFSANLYGMVFTGTTDNQHTLYYAQDYIQTKIGAIPSTS